MKKTATHIRDLGSPRAARHRIEQKFYHLSPPLDGHELVVVSAADVPFSGPETYIFPADERGRCSSMSELEGSFRGDMNHEQALHNVGYEVVIGDGTVPAPSEVPPLLRD